MRTVGEGRGDRGTSAGGGQAGIPIPTQTLLLIPPYGGKLVTLLVPGAERDEYAEAAQRLPSIRLTERSVCDLELLAVGAFSPLDRFMLRADYLRVTEDMRLADGTLFPIPVTLPVADTRGLRLDSEVALRSPKNELLGTLTIEEIFEWDYRRECSLVYGTTDPRHPLVAEMASWGKLFVSGRVRVLGLPTRHDFRDLRHTPAQVRLILERLGHSNVVAFQTRNPMHRVHEEITKRASQEIDGSLLLHPVVGLTKPGDLDHYSRVRAYRALADRYYDPRRTVLSLLPLAMRMAGPREAIWHAIIRRNFGANHLIIGRDHAGPGADSQGRPFYPPYAAQELMAAHESEIGVRMVPFKELAYLPDEDRYEEVHRIAADVRSQTISGTQIRSLYVKNGQGVPGWLTRPEVAAILSEVTPPPHRQGLCVWLTGLPCAGKSTIADILTVMLMQHGRRVTLLDGDVVRTHLSAGLGFSKEDRITNVLRIGFVASEIVRHHGTVVCASISPYRSVRNQVREMVSATHFVLVFVDTPQAVCEQRDTKGMYAAARRGEIVGLTGVSDPYEEPIAPELRINTVDRSPDKNAEEIVRYLIARGFVQKDGTLETAPHGQ